MKTKKQVLNERSDYSTLINAVISRVGMSSVSDISNYGIEGGFPGFIYYTDTHRFAIRHRKDIVLLLEEMSSDFGESIEEMVSNFGVFRNLPMDRQDKKDLSRYLYDGKPDQGTITNVMAWFAAEEVCRWFEN